MAAENRIIGVPRKYWQSIHIDTARGMSVQRNIRQENVLESKTNVMCAFKELNIETTNEIRVCIYV